MRSRSERLPALLLGTALLAGVLGVGTLASATTGTGGDAPASAPAARSGHTMAVSTQASGDDPDGDGCIPAVPQVTGVTPSTASPPPRYFHEFQANRSVTHTAPDDPVVHPGQPGKSHGHTLMGDTTNAGSTTASPEGGATTCKVPADASAYWTPSLFKGDQKILPVGAQTISHKSGVTDYTSVRPFPKGLRFVVGDPMQSADGFRRHPGFVEGWECGDSYFNTDFPASRPSRADVQLDIRFQAPSCWDGKYLDTPDHQSHTAYPVVKPGTNDTMCPADHPVALPMIEFKMAFPVNGDMSRVHLASGTGHSFHYDFFNAWDDATLKALVGHCVVGGLQCDARGYDQTHPEAGAALNADYRLP
ncbi:DUF1996 domain-containing protein [Streptomyces sp. TG1A-8]|uniref:DUF1996 domain-containing protein n=1 Tax=Streptomyces sp. TG1A-8 TaxID=3051385 RepID=UPI00265C6B97|nr:DUF1996 domain-containing protein [Streptomyces sp. TG1A-8]MDO0929027.1 DUF1996 domain-containing protein [Streptomyces sp. TG1A-8]